MCASAKQLDGKSLDSVIQNLSALNQNLRVVSTSLVRGTDSCVVCGIISSRGIRDVSELGVIQATMFATKTCDSRMGSVMDCHINRHADTVKSVQLSDGVVPLIEDTNIGMVLLLVELVKI